MRSIGIDIGSTYTKYCVMANNDITHLFVERTPVRQRDYFKQKLSELEIDFPNNQIVSCGYGKNNIEAVKNVSELTALALGLHHQHPSASVALDIGGQDTKLIRQSDGKIKEFFVNDKCAAGSGLFLNNALNILGVRFDDVALNIAANVSNIKLSSVCAVFAQSEIVELMADNISPERIAVAAIRQILIQATSLLNKCDNGGTIALSGGLTQIRGIREFASDVLETVVVIPSNAHYFSAIGCAMMA